MSQVGWISQASDGLVGALMSECGLRSEVSGLD